MDKKDKQLIGIKAIAGYLKMSVRNVYYWEKKLNLPIHRVSESSGYRIYAFKDEIDQWLKEKDAETLKRPNYKRNVWAAVLLAALLLSTLLLILLNQSSTDDPEGPKKVSVNRNMIYIENSKGDVLWKFNHGDITTQRDVGKMIDMANIDDDPQNEVVACIYDWLNKDKFNITLFDHDGREIWKRMMDPEHTFSKVEIKNFFRPMPVKFARSKNNETLIISKWVHMERFLSIVACHNLKGDLVSQYLHTGHLESTMQLIDLDGDGCVEIVLGGTNNLLNGEAIICVLPLQGFYGINPPYRVEIEYKNQEFNLKNYIADKIIVPGNQLFYLRFKKTGYLSQYRKTHFISSTLAYSSDNIIHFHLNEWEVIPGKLTVGFNYSFDRNFTIKQVIAPGGLLKIYPEMLRKGDINISLDQLLEIYAKSVYRWDDGRWVPVKSNLRKVD
jgi:hypothetical protein